MASLLASCTHDVEKVQDITTPANKEDAAPVMAVEAAANQASEAVGNGRMTSKGIITSEHDVPVFSRMSSVITRLDIKEGDRVKAGQTLVWLDNTQASYNVKQGQTQVEQAKFQYQTILVGQGYEADKEQLAPEHIRKAARTRSSLDLYELQLENARTMLGYCQISAPVSGVVTDKKVFRYDLAREGNPLFRIIDPEHLNISFTILESELKRFSVGTKVKVTPIAYADEVHKATVTMISPKVDENGMIRIKARIEDPTHLLVGMSALVAL